MRLFVAVHLPGEIKDRLALLQDRLRRAQADVSWVRPGGLHITLKFLGEVEPKRSDRIRLALREVAQGVTPFSLEVAGTGTFGGRIPRVVWAGVQRGSEPLTGLARRVDDSLGHVGFPKEKRGFNAHFTLGRVRSSRNVEPLLAALNEKPAEEFGTASVDWIALMQSELNPSGAIHTEVDRFFLGMA
jgi:2'-5' RNA ligase